MNILKSICTVVFSALILSTQALAADGDLFVQVDNDDNSFDEAECSILQVDPQGDLSEFISASQIEAATGSESNECQNTGLAIDTVGNVFFGIDFFISEVENGPDISGSNILMATPEGSVSLFATNAQLAAATGASRVDLENGMAFGPDGALFVNDSVSNSILRIPVPLGPITRVVTEDDIRALLGPTARIDLDSGIAVDQFGNIFFGNDDGGGGPDAQNINNVIFKYSPTGGLSILTTQQQIVNATGEIDIDLDVGMVLDGKLFVLLDDPCSCLLLVNPNDGGVKEFITSEQITDVTGEDEANPEGGLASNGKGDLFIGDSGGEEGDDNEPNIVRVRNAGTSLFVSDTEIEGFYDDIYDGSFEPVLQASMAVEGFRGGVAEIPTLSEWGLIAMAIALGLVGFVVMRKRTVKA